MLTTVLMMLLSAGEPAPADLAALLKEAEAGNPAIAAARSTILASEAVPSQAEAPPDPVASIAYTNETLDELTLGESEDSLLTFTWTQEVPYPGKLRLAGEAARREVDVNRQRLQAARLDVASRVKQTFAQLYLIDRTVSILGDSRMLLVSFQETARARYETGAGLLQNVLKAQTEVARLDADLERLSQERRSVVAELNRLVGRRQDAPLGPALALPSAAQTINWAALESDAMERSPEVLEMDAAVLREEALLDLAQRQLKPDLVWSAAYTNRGDLEPMVMGMFGVQLPLHRQQKQAQGVTQASHSLDAARSAAESARLGVLSEVRDLTARAKRAEAVARLYAEGVVPQARGSLESASAAYGVGQVDFLTLITDFSALLGYEIEYETQRSEGISALAALERLTARELVVPVAESTDERIDHE